MYRIRITKQCTREQVEGLLSRFQLMYLMLCLQADGDTKGYAQFTGNNNEKYEPKYGKITYTLPSEQEFRPGMTFEVATPGVNAKAEKLLSQFFKTMPPMQDVYLKVEEI